MDKLRKQNSGNIDEEIGEGENGVKIDEVIGKEISGNTDELTGKRPAGKLVNRL